MRPFEKNRKKEIRETTEIGDVLRSSVSFFSVDMNCELYFERENKQQRLPTIIPNERKKVILQELDVYVRTVGIPYQNMEYLKTVYESMIPKWQSDVNFLKGWLHLIKT